MSRPKYLENYTFHWEALSILLEKQSAIDSHKFLSYVRDEDDAYHFLNGYGFDLDNNVESSELFGIYQEALAFIKRYFLKEGNPEGLNYELPKLFYQLTQPEKLILMATQRIETPLENSYWASIILKTMHTILHADKDLRYRYFDTIQTQILDKIYKYIYRDEEKSQLMLHNETTGEKIELHEFTTKSQKSRDSIILKLLHKKESVAEDLFDRIGVRFITKNKLDAMRLLKFLFKNHIVILNNIKPSRSINTLIDLKAVKAKNYSLVKKAIRNQISEENYKSELISLFESSVPPLEKINYKNEHSLEGYRAIHLTSRQLIKYKNPFARKFLELRKEAKKILKETPDSLLAEKIIGLDSKHLTKELRFFYPYEIQITDIKSHLENTKGEASHQEYKKQQIKSASERLFAPLIKKFPPTI